MVLALATGFITLACQGCVSSGVADNYAYGEPAVEPSLGMTLAMPGMFGDGALNAPSDAAFAGAPVPAVSAPAPALRLTDPDAGVAVFVTASAPSAFSLTGSGLSGVPESQTGFGWSNNPAHRSRGSARFFASHYSCTISQKDAWKISRAPVRAWRGGSAHDLVSPMPRPRPLPG